jgi:hypothetical protein
MPNPAAWKFRKLYTTGYVANSQIPVELTKYEQTGYFTKLLVRLTGTVNTGTSSPGTPTGRTNPEDLLVSCILQTSPTVASVIPFNQVSGRGLFIDASLNNKCVRKATAIVDGSGVVSIDVTYELNFKRRGLRKAIEYGFDISRYTSALLTLTFGDQTRLYTGSSNTWSFAGTNIEVWGHMAYNVQPKEIHAHELFEQNFPVLATQSDFLINQLPSGFLYTDLCFLIEQNNALSNAVLNNIDIEGGGRIWEQSGDNNADAIQKYLVNQCFDGSVRDATDGNFPVNTFPNTGIYVAVSMPWTASGMYSRSIDAIAAQIIAKLNVTFNSVPTNVRLIGRRMLPAAVYNSATKAAGSQ